MMFVPTHEHKENGNKVILKNFWGSFGLHIIEDNYFVKVDVLKKQINDYEPITLPCPHCQHEIQQAERVECECGWIACAVPLEVVTHGLSLDVDGMHCDTDCSENPTYLRYGIFNDDDTSTWMVTIRFIGGFNWLEIKAGKEN